MRFPTPLPLALVAIVPACVLAQEPAPEPAEPHEDSATLTAMVEDLAAHDVVVLGEEHDNRTGHRLQLRIVQLLHQRRPDLIVSMEMFERDVQGELDRYLAGAIDEEAFLEGSRPWPTYRDFYRPVVEYCRDHDLPVLAANMPRELARKVSTDGVETVAESAWVARETSAPRYAYWRAFQDAMKDHEGVTEATMYRFYQAQCYKDDTMAESIVDWLAAARQEGRDPLVVHLCGKFHSDLRLGTVARVTQREPNLRVAVVTMQPKQVLYEVRPGGAVSDYVLVVPAEPPRPRPKKAEAEAQPGPAAAPETEPSAEQAPDEVTEEAPPAGRPGLGFMPEYEADVDGVLVASVRPGGAADEAGIRAGDVLQVVDGKEVLDVSEYMDVLETLRVGQKIEVEVLRAGKPEKLSLVVGASRR